MAPPRPERSGPARLAAAWGALAREQRLVMLAAGVLLATMLLPWYSRSVDAVVGGRLETASSGTLAITVFSWVEAAIFLVAVGVTVLVLARGDRRAFHLPGGDGTIVTAAGAWATFLIFYRFVDQPGGAGGGQLQVEYGLSWGIFFGLLAALALAGTGLRLRAAQIAEPALPGDVAPDGGAAVTARAPRTGEPEPRGTARAGSRAARAGEATREQRRKQRDERRRATPVSADTPVRERRPRPPEATPANGAHDEAPTRHSPPDEAPTWHAPPDGAPTRPFGDPPDFEPPEFQPPRRRPPEAG